MSKAGDRGKELTKMDLRLGIYPNFTGISSDNRAFTKLAPEAIKQCTCAHKPMLKYTHVHTHALLSSLQVGFYLW